MKNINITFLQGSFDDIEKVKQAIGTIGYVTNCKSEKVKNKELLSIELEMFRNDE